MKFHIIINATVLCSLFSVAKAQAQNQVLTLAEARAKALEQNKEIKKANLTVEQTGYDVKTYKSNYFPRVSLVAPCCHRCIFLFPRRFHNTGR